MAMAMAPTAVVCPCSGLRASPRARPSLRSSFFGSSAASCARERVAMMPGRRGGALSVRCGGAFIPAEHRWMYEGIESLGPDIWNKTWYPKASDHENVKKQWYVVDAADKRLGRLASTIAIYIRGKNLPTYTPSVDMGAYVIVV
ncbi:hypothetical protein O6H91_Y006800 [Diphasiastrum complanatum]|nr:hypothetical protein O6H91_Y006800 [Diphasiastrum complanatum]